MNKTSQFFPSEDETYVIQSLELIKVNYPKKITSKQVVHVINFLRDSEINNHN
jgi:hypothetical protein